MKAFTESFIIAASLAVIALGATKLSAQGNEAQSTYVTLRFAPGTHPTDAPRTIHREFKPVISARPSQSHAPLPVIQAAPASLSQTEAVGYGALRFPADVQNFGGPTVGSAKSHAIFMQQEGNVCAISACWGNPEGFLKDLGRSDFIHVADQYVGETSDKRYTLGQGYTTFFQPQTEPFTDADIQSVVTAAAQASGEVGYGNIYHVFLPPGVDVCFDSTFTACYSPDVPASFVLCAYHYFFDVPGLGHLLYTVEPYQDVLGCSERPGTPNGSLIDSTNDVLLHETFEMITDPDANAWLNGDSFDALNGEIGDECEFLVFGEGGAFQGFDPSIWSVGDRIYATQPIYNNDRHACTTAP